MDYGVEQIKKALGIVIDLGMSIEDHLSDDGKISLSEAASTAIDLAPDIFSVAKNAAELKLEVQDWDPAERLEVLEWAVQKFDLDNDRAEAAIELALGLLVKLGDLISILKKDTE